MTPEGSIMSAESTAGKSAGTSDVPAAGTPSLATVETEVEKVAADMAQIDAASKVAPQPEVSKTGEVISLGPDPNIRYGVFLDTRGQYYAAVTPLSPEDCLVPGPSKNLYDTLVANLGLTIHKSVMHEAIAAAGNGEKTQYTNTGIVI